MFKELWARIKNKQRTGAKLTRKEQILAELDRDIGTAKQIADRSGVKLTIVRTTLSQLKKAGKIRDTGKDAGDESIWEVVKG
jgi:DNA-binding IscR family transcriptional regulator